MTVALVRLFRMSAGLTFWESVQSLLQKGPTHLAFRIPSPVWDEATSFTITLLESAQSLLQKGPTHIAIRTPRPGGRGSEAMAVLTVLGFPFFYHGRRTHSAALGAGNRRDGWRAEIAKPNRQRGFGRRGDLLDYRCYGVCMLLDSLDEASSFRCRFGMCSHAYNVT